MQTPTQKTLPLISVNRECGSCTKCCEGYLYSDVKFDDGRIIELGPNPCPILELGKGCGDYENRPQSPCRGFQCEWTRQPDVYPEEMRPDKINTIFSLQEVEGIPYLRITEAGSVLTAENLSFGIKLALMNRFNLYWEVDGKVHWFGNKDFVAMMNKHKNNNLIKENEPKNE